MYYKLLHKTILTSALVSLICASVPQAKAQELVLEDEVDISLPTDALEAEAVVGLNEEQDVIPLENTGVIVPQKSLAENIDEAAQKAKENVQDVPNTAGQIDEEMKTSMENSLDAGLDFETVSAPSAENVEAFMENFEQTGEAALPAEDAKLDAVQPLSAELFGNQDKKEEGTQDVVPEIENNPAANISPELKFGDAVLVQSNNDLFTQMSDIEKQTTLLTLQLKREKIRNEIEAAKAVREKAALEKRLAEEARLREQEEWRKEQEAKVIREQVALKQKEIELEKLKQRKALTAYMNQMLEQKQAWINENAKLYEEIEGLKTTNRTIRKAYAADLENISLESEKLFHNAEMAKSNHDRIVENMMIQNEQLKNRIEADAAALRLGQGNPFAGGPEGLESASDNLIKPVSIAREYAIMEIIGKGDNLLVRLINKQGDSFIAKKGTVLQTGHTIEDIQQNYVQFDRNGLKDFLYTATAALAAEPDKLGTEPEADNAATASRRRSGRNETTAVKPRANLVGDQQMPSLSNSMFVK
ncbi:MAG: hypothetical protein J5895_00280 [Alphaproteobacteria bacterium]|nr:hypothetical protein [Alphaproteobacteria bacterium]